MNSLPVRPHWSGDADYSHVPFFIRRMDTHGRLSALVPGLLIPEYGASLTSTIYLRGIGSRMENPSMGLYVDGIPIMDKNAYDFDWTGINFAALMRGPAATLYGRNAMSGTLVMQSVRLMVRII